MKKVKWEMEEQFIFPEFAGIPTGTANLQVTPRFTEQRNEDAVRLTGIYHIAAKVIFDEVEGEVKKSDTAILIDDVDLDGQMGYFEYAVPLNIDLPAEIENVLDVAVANTVCDADGKGDFGISWNVECSYKEMAEEIIIEEKVNEIAEKEIQTEVVEETPVSEAVEAAIAILNNPLTSHDDEVLSFISELNDGLSMTAFRSNDVFMKGEG